MTGYIVRIDKPKDSTQGTHGWQVRVHNVGQAKKYRSKLFSDGKYGSNDNALAAAKEYLETYLHEHPDGQVMPSNQPYLRSKLSKRNTSGVTGVSRTHDLLPNGTRSYYWGAFLPKGPYGRKTTKKFYISVHGEEEAKRLAIAFRKNWEEAIDSDEKALKEFFDREHFDKMEDWRYLNLLG